MVRDRRTLGWENLALLLGFGALFGQRRARLSAPAFLTSFLRLKIHILHLCLAVDVRRFAVTQQRGLGRCPRPGIPRANWDPLDLTYLVVEQWGN